jgi:hypothetical protein
MNTLESTILELVSEDDYGSWELWWRVVETHKNMEKDKLISSFTETLKAMVSEGTLKAKRKNSAGQFDPVKFDITELQSELEQAQNPNPDKFYWFGT